MAVGIAIAGLVLSAATTTYGIVEKKKAEKEAEERMAAMGDVTNPFASLKPSTYGASLNTTQSLRRMASQTDSLAQSGSRGGALIPQIARQDALITSQAAADLDSQQKQINQQIASGETYRQNMEENRYLQEMGGYAQQYNYGQNMMMQGINQGAGVLASGFAEGGAFNQGGTQGNFQGSNSFQLGGVDRNFDYSNRNFNTINPPMNMSMNLVPQYNN